VYDSFLTLLLVNHACPVMFEFQMVKQQFGAGYSVHPYSFQFDTSVKQGAETDTLLECFNTTSHFTFQEGK